MQPNIGLHREKSWLLLAYAFAHVNRSDYFSCSKRQKMFQAVPPRMPMWAIIIFADDNCTIYANIPGTVRNLQMHGAPSNSLQTNM